MRSFAIITAALAVSACEPTEPLDGYDRFDINYGGGWYAWSETSVYPDGRVERRVCPQDCTDGQGVIESSDRLSATDLAKVEKVLRKYRARAVLIDDFNVAAWHSPDGSECKDLTMDAGGMGLIWVKGNSEEVVGIDFGCDSERFGKMYDELRALNDILVPEFDR